MKITINVDEVSLTSAIEATYGQGVEHGSDGSPEPGDYYVNGHRTLGDLVAAQMLVKLTTDERYHDLRRRITEIRDEEIRAAVRPLVLAAIQNPSPQTNAFGEPTGATVGLRELIVKEARETLKRGNDYGRGPSMLSMEIEKAVKAAFLDVIAAEVKTVRDAVSRSLSTQAAGALEQVVKNALAGR